MNKSTSVKRKQILNTSDRKKKKKGLGKNPSAHCMHLKVNLNKQSSPQRRASKQRAIPDPDSLLMLSDKTGER